MTRPSSARPVGRWHRWRFWIAGLLAVDALVVAVLMLNLRGEGALGDEIEAAATHAADTAPDAALVARGAYLARAGNCAGCHTARGGEAYAGGRGIDTPFGTVYSSNLTPDDETGLGRWSAPQFWRAMHHGRSADGRLLVPAFPYTSTTQVNRADSDAIHAYLRSLTPVRRASQPHDLQFPFGTQPALAVWRALYFRPGEYRPDADRSAEWNRGAYLVQGLGHCNACHASRNALGATGGPLDLDGGLIPVQNWYAPSLTDPREAGVGGWPTEAVVALLKTGVADVRGARVTASGPMGEVVQRSTQHLSEADLVAMATYLQSLHAPPPATERAALASPAEAAAPSARGAALYGDHCASCHGERGEGVPGAYPPLAGNRAVTMAVPANLVRIVLEGGFAPSTAGHPRPYGMPPFAQTLASDDVAALLTHLRGSWGNRAEPVSALQVSRYRGDSGN